MHAIPNMKKSTFSSNFYRLSLLFTIIPTLSLLLFLTISTSSTVPFLRTLGLAGIRSLPPELRNARVAVCLVGGARRFELTGPSIIEHVLEHYPNSDLFLHSPLDNNAFKLSLLKSAPRIASVRIFEPKAITVSKSATIVLNPITAPSGFQGLLQYFNLVEGCLTMIKNHQTSHNFTYDWIVRTRVDGYWSAWLDPANFVPGHYTVPIGSSFGGLNDRLGIGDLETSTAALSRLSLIPALDSAGFRQLNSETAFRAQLRTRNVSVAVKALPFCVVSDRKYFFPPGRIGVPVAAMSSRGSLSGAKCRPCEAACRGTCAAKVAERLDRGWSWADAVNGSLELCDARSEWDSDWEMRFDRAAGEKLAAQRRRVKELSFEKCVTDFEEMKRRAEGSWEVPPPEKVCGMGLKKG